MTFYTQYVYKVRKSIHMAIISGHLFLLVDQKQALATAFLYMLTLASLTAALRSSSVL